MRKMYFSPEQSLRLQAMGFTHGEYCPHYVRDTSGGSQFKDWTLFEGDVKVLKSGAWDNIPAYTLEDIRLQVPVLKDKFGDVAFLYFDTVTNREGPLHIVKYLDPEGKVVLESLSSTSMADAFFHMVEKIDKLKKEKGYEYLTY